MNKIAAYEIALENIELEKRANYLVDAYGTSEGYMPGAYLQAFDQLEKEGGILKGIGRVAKSIGKSVSGGLKGLGVQGGKKHGINVLGKNITGRQLGYGVMGAGAAGAGGLAFGAGRMSKR